MSQFRDSAVSALCRVMLIITREIWSWITELRYLIQWRYYISRRASTLFCFSLLLSFSFMLCFVLSFLLFKSSLTCGFSLYIMVTLQIRRSPIHKTSEKNIFLIIYWGFHFICLSLRQRQAKEAICKTFNVNSSTEWLLLVSGLIFCEEMRVQCAWLLSE